MRGFVLSIVSLLFLSFLFSMATTLHNHYLAMERSLLLPQPISYASYSVGSAAVSLNAILGPGVSIDANSTGLRVSLIDTVPLRDASAELSDYSAMLEGALAGQTHSAISVDLANVSDGSNELLINRRYAYTNGANGEMVFRAESGGTNATAYEINVSVAEARANLTGFNFSETGDIELTLTYSDLNGTVVEHGLVSSSYLDRFRVGYAGGGSLEVGAGRASGHDGSLWVIARNVTAETGVLAVLPPPGEDDRIGYEYDASMDYTTGGAEVSRRIGT